MNREDAKDTKEEERRRKKKIILYREGWKRGDRLFLQACVLQYRFY
ncbi:hypothetical protein [Microcoleus sp. AR_TQ3_B6]